MSTRSSQTATKIQITEDQVVEYLRSDPDFFERHLDLLAMIKVPHPVGTAVSLVERQVGLLQDRGQQLERKLQELIAVARENEQVSTRMHHLALAMLEAESADEVMAAAQEILRSEFRADFVVFRFTDQAGSVCESHPDLCLPADSIDRQRFRKCMDGGQPVCGRVGPEQIDTLFQGNAEQVTSAAMLPLQHGKAFGVLGLGSTDPDRFNPAMGTLFLSHMGELVGRALARHLG
jgi:uncharacterized protein YigA (DUF484 family)